MLFEADNILIIDKPVSLPNNIIEISRLISQGLKQPLVDQALVVVIKELIIIKDSIQVRMHIWPARQSMAENSINEINKL